MIPPTQLARILAARRQKARRKPPRPTLPNQAERIYLGALRRYSDRLEQLTKEAIATSDWSGIRFDYDPDQPREANGQWGSTGSVSQSAHATKVKERIAKIRGEREKSLANKPAISRAIHAIVFKAAEDVRAIIDRFSAGQNDKEWGPNSEARVLQAAMGSGNVPNSSVAEHIAVIKIRERMHEAEFDTDTHGEHIWKERDLQTKILYELASGYAHTKEETHKGFRDWQQILRNKRHDGMSPGPMRFVSRASRMLDGVRVQLSQESRRLPYEDTAAAVTRHAKTQALKVVGIKPEQFTTGAAVRGWREKNVALVTRMTDDQLSRISDILDKYDGANPFDLADQLQKEFDFTRARSELIARDQVLKLNGDLTAEAHRQAGIEEYTWSTSKDQSVRDRHADLEGTRQRWDDPPVINDQGETGHPGDDYQCRCVPIPYLPELEQGPETGPIATQDYQQAAAVVGEQVQTTESESGLSALRDYVTSSAAINTLMRDLFAGTVVAAESKALGAIEDLGTEFRAAKRKAALSGTVYRGERIHSEDRWEEFAPGKILTYPQYTSTTLSPLEAGTYTGSGRGVLLEIDQTGGVPVGGLAGLGKVSREVLLSPGKYRVISRRVTGDKIRVKVRRI